MCTVIEWLKGQDPEEDCIQITSPAPQPLASYKSPLGLIDLIYKVGLIIREHTSEHCCEYLVKIYKNAYNHTRYIV